MGDINDILSGKKLEQFIKDEREKVIPYLSKRYRVPTEEAEDAFQDGLVALFEAVNSGRFKEEQHEYSLVRYFHTCCKNQLLKKLGKIEKETIPSDPDELGTGDYDISALEDDNQHNEDIELMQDILADLPKKCRSLIWGKYHDGFSATEMAAMLNYNSDRVAITSLNRCMEKLRNRFNETRRLYDEK